MRGKEAHERVPVGSFGERRSIERRSVNVHVADVVRLAELYAIVMQDFVGERGVKVEVRQLQLVHVVDTEQVLDRVAQRRPQVRSDSNVSSRARARKARIMVLVVAQLDSSLRNREGMDARLRHAELTVFANSRCASSRVTAPARTLIQGAG